MQKKDLFYFLTFAFINFLSKILPGFCLDFLARMTGRIIFKLNKKHRNIIEANLKICFPQMDEKKREELTRKIYEKFSRYGLAILRERGLKSEEFLEKISFDNFDLIEKARSKKGPLIIASAHFGNWEFLIHICALLFGKTAFIARRLDSEIMNKILQKKREQFDTKIIYTGGAMQRSQEAMSEGRAVIILSDQDARNEARAARVSFFKKDLAFSTGTALLAQKMNALILPLFIYEDEKNIYHLRAFEPLDPREKSLDELVDAQAAALEEMIIFKPEEYFFFHKRFKSLDEKIYED